MQASSCLRILKLHTSIYPEGVLAIGRYTEISIREYVDADRDVCLSIFDSNRPKYFAEHERKEFADWLDQADRESYSIMKLDDEIVACGGIYRDAEKTHIGMAWGMVRHDLHSNGLGRRLTEFRLQQMEELYPDVPQRLATSQHTFEFYEKLGFATTKVTADGFGPGIDRYDMLRGS